MEEEDDEKRDFKRNLAAYVYQLKLLILMLWRGFDNMKINQFKLGTELKEGEIKWDDALFFCKQNGKNSVRYLQAKHSTNDNMKLKYEDFVRCFNANFDPRIDLKKHFISFRKIKQKTWNEEIIDLILCTNIPLDSLALQQKNGTNILQFVKVPVAKTDDIFYDFKTVKPWEKYQLEDFTNGKTKCVPLENQLKYATDLKLLANEFVVCSFNKKDVKLDLSNFWISSYLNTLFEEDVIEMTNRSARFTHKFLNNATTLSRSTKEFRKILFEACKREVLKTLKDVQLIMSSGSKRYDMWSNNGRKNIADDIIDHIFDKNVQLNYSSGLPFLTNAVMNIFKFSTDFTDIRKNSIFRDLFVSMYTEEILKNKELEFKQFYVFKNVHNYDTAFRQLANDFKNAYDEANKKGEKCINFNSQHLKAMERMEGLNGSVFFATMDKHKISFNDHFFKSNVTSVNPFANSFIKHLKHAFGIHFAKIKDYEIKYYNYPPYFSKLKDNGNIEDDIKEFIKLFCIVKSPNEADLMDEVSAELGEHFNLLDADLMTFDLFQKILNWAKTNEDKLLTAKDVEKYKKHWKEKLAKEFETGCAFQYCQKLKDFSMEYDSEMEKVIEFLQVSSKQLIYLETDTLLLTAIKLLQTLTKHFEEKDTPSFTVSNPTKNYEKIDRYIFNPLSVLLRMSKYVINAFSSNMNPLIIVDKKTKNEADIKIFAEKISEILQKNPEKKVIVITNKSTKFHSMHQNIEYEKCRIENVTFKDLKSNYQNKILETSKVIFQGKETILNKLFDKKEDAAELIDSKTMEDLITLKPVKIGEPVKTFTPFEENLYRPRKFYLNEISKKIFKDKRFENNHKFIIESNDIVNLKLLVECEIHDFSSTQAFNLHGHVFMTSKHIGLNKKKIMEENSNYFIHWLKLENKKFIWVNSYVPPKGKLPEEFKYFVEKTKHYVDEDYFLNYIKENKVLIITDSTGMGKSYVLTKFLRNVEDEKIWKIRINLNQYTATLNEIKKQLGRDSMEIIEEPPAKKRKLSQNNENFVEKRNLLFLNYADLDIQTRDFGKLILKSLLNKNEPDVGILTFENRMFNFFFMKQKMLIVFDGFDEIAPTYEREVNALFMKLKDDSQKKIWVTSRTNCKMQLETIFNTFSYDLKPFNKKDQRIYLTKFWLNKWKEEKCFEMPNQHLLKIYVDKLIEDASLTIKEILGIPLQTKIFAEIFQENERKEENEIKNSDKEKDKNKLDEEKRISWPSCFDYVLSDRIEYLDFTKKLKNIFVVYKYFVKKKIYNYFLHEKGIVDLEKPFAKKIKKDVYRNEHEAHKIFGTISLCGETLCNKIISESEKKIKKHWLKNFEARVENIGIIDDINADGHPRFNHFTYGEYFAACYLIEKLMDNPSSAKDVFEIADEILKRYVTVFVQCFKFLLKQRINDENLFNGDTVLQFSARNGFVNCVNLFINSYDFNDTFSYAVEKNKTILYYAADSKNLDVQIYLLLYYYLLFDTSYELTFLPFLFSFLCDINAAHENDILSDIKMASEKLPQPKTNFNFPFDKKLYEIILRSENYVFKSVFFITKPSTIKLTSKKNYAKLLKHFSIENIKKIINFMKFDLKYDLNVIEFFESIFEYNKTDIEKEQLFEYFIDNVQDEKKENEVIKAFVECAVEYESFELLENITQKIQKLADKDVIEIFKKACRSNTAAVIKSLLKYVKHFNLPFSILHTALKENSSFEIIKEIVEADKSDVDVDVNENGETALFTAVKYENNIKIIKYLISKGADPNKLNKENKSPWTLAVGNAVNEIIRYFLYFSKSRLDGPKNMIESIKEYFDAPEIYKENLKFSIECAVKERNILWCKFLLLNGGDECITNLEEKMKHYRFCGFNKDSCVVIKVFEALTDIRHKIVPRCCYKLLNIKHYNRKTMETLIINEMKSYKDDNGNTLLHLAIKQKKPYVFQFLLNNGFSCNVENDKEEIPIELSKFTYTLKDVAGNIYKIFKMAIKDTVLALFGTNYAEEVYEVYVTDKYQQTLLHHAVLENNIQAAEKLIAYGSEINDKNRQNETQLSLAVKNNNIAMVKTLLKNPIVFDTGLYDKLPDNESSKFLSNVRKCLYCALNEDAEAFKEKMENFRNVVDFNIAISTKLKCGTNREISLRSYICRNDELLIYCLQKGVNIELLDLPKKDGSSFLIVLNAFNGNKQSETVLRNLKTIAEYINSKKIDSKSIINYCEQNFMKYLVSFVKSKEIANKIISSVRFQVGDDQLTLLQIAKKVNDEIIAEWLIKEKGATDSGTGGEGRHAK